MKSTELRLDNWIIPNNSEIPFRVYRIDETAINTWSEDYFNPVPLTPDILQKTPFSFREHLDDWYINLELTDTILIYKNGWAKICASNQQPCLLIPLLYLHELQNLYFALTQTELTINLT